jgi:hypothetical protein
MGDSERSARGDTSDRTHATSFTTYTHTVTSIHAPVFVYVPIELRGTKILVELGADEEDEDDAEEHSSAELNPSVTTMGKIRKDHNLRKGRNREKTTFLRVLKEKLRRLFHRD